jgi:hypothetical protein
MSRSAGVSVDIEIRVTSRSDRDGTQEQRIRTGAVEMGNDDDRDQCPAATTR